MSELYCAIYVKSDEPFIKEIKTVAGIDSAEISEENGITRFYFEDLPKDEPELNIFLFEHKIPYDVSIYANIYWDAEEKSYRPQSGQKEYSALVTDSDRAFLSPTSNIVNYLNRTKTLEDLKQDNAIQLIMLREKYPLKIKE